MFKVAILGCENSHAANFLKVIQNENIQDVEIVGVFSEFDGAAEELHERFGVPVAESYDAFVGQIDGLIITARNGDNHYKYAKPYLDSGIPLFIDKPITNTEEDAREFMQILKDRNIPVSGGSTLKHAESTRELKALIASGEQGQPIGGYVRAPMNIDSEHGGFFFYSQHLVQIMWELFGYYPKSVLARRNGDQVTCIVRYEDYDISCLYVDHRNIYYAAVNFKGSVEGRVFPIPLVGAPSREFHDFYDLLQGKPMPQSYEELFAPVFTMNAIQRAILSGNEEPVGRI